MNSPGSKTRLFSDDGIDANRSRFEPQFIYFPDESTEGEIKFLFTTLKSQEISGRNSANEISIRDLPFSYDLSMLSSEGSGELLTLEDVTNGMCRIATHFISLHELIQSRANAYVRCKLAGAESILNGMVVSQNEQSVERDQILLSSMTVPSSPRDQYTGTNEELEGGQLSRTPSSVERIQRTLGSRLVATPPPTPSLFRSPSVRHEQMNSFPANVFSLDDETLAASLAFMPDIFEPAGFASRKALSLYDADKLQELWEFFDFDDDGIVTRDDLLMGVSNIAKNYIATDSFTQLLAHAYVQRKIRRAVLAIRKHQQALDKQQQQQQQQQSHTELRNHEVERAKPNDSGHSNQSDLSPAEAVKYKPGTVLVYTDEEGNNHITTVIRQSNRGTDSGDAYYIETKGVKLYVPVVRLRRLTEQETAALERREMPLHHQHNQHQQYYQQQHQQHEQQHQQAQNYYQQKRSPHAGTTQTEASQSGMSLIMQSNQHHHHHRSADSISGGGRTTPPHALANSSSAPNTENRGRTPLPTSSSGTGHRLYSSNNDQQHTHNGQTTAAAASSVEEGVPASKGGILGYLKSGMGILGIGGTKQSVVVPQASSEPGDSHAEDGAPFLASNLTSTDIMSLEGGIDPNDSDSVFTNGSLYCAPTGLVAISDLSGQPQQQDLMSNNTSTENLHLNDIPTMEATLADGPETLPTAVATPVTAVGGGEGEEGGDRDSAAPELAMSASQRLRTTAALLESDAEILAAVARVTSTSFKLTRTMVPKPKKIEPYPIYFNRGKNGFFEFNQVDFGVVFSPFMKEIIPAQDPRWQSSHESLSETNRCFFLHFGVAMGLHPFALQHCFRCAAAELLKFPENEMTIFFGEALESLLLRNDFVDAQVLSAIWPVEFDKYKILIVRVDHNGRIESFTSFRSEVGPVDEQGEWAGEELIFTLQWNHFTILKPKSEQLSKPITAVLAAASMIGIMPLEFITKVDADPAKRFQICP